MSSRTQRVVVRGARVDGVPDAEDVVCGVRVVGCYQRVADVSDLMEVVVASIWISAGCSPGRTG